MSILITNATVITVDETDRVIENGAVYVEKDRIAAVGDARVLGEQYSMAETVVDGEGKVVLPGFVSNGFCRYLDGLLFRAAHVLCSTGLPGAPIPTNRNEEAHQRPIVLVCAQSYG